jgi:hypothetical protein
MELGLPNVQVQRQRDIAELALDPEPQRLHLRDRVDLLPHPQGGPPVDRDRVLTARASPIRSPHPYISQTVAAQSAGSARQGHETGAAMGNGPSAAQLAAICASAGLALPAVTAMLAAGACPPPALMLAWSAGALCDQVTRPQGACTGASITP